MVLIQVCGDGVDGGQEKKSLVLKPREELALSVMLQPSTVESLSASLIFRHCSSSHPFKWKVRKRESARFFFYFK